MREGRKTAQSQGIKDEEKQQHEKREEGKEDEWAETLVPTFRHQLTKWPIEYRSALACKSRSPSIAPCAMHTHTAGQRIERTLTSIFFFVGPFLSSHSRFYWFRHSILANVGPAVCVRTVLEKSTPSLTSRVFSETPTASSTGRHKKPMGKKQRWKAVRVVRSIHRLASRRVTRFTLGVVCCRRRRLFCV